MKRALQIVFGISVAGMLFSGTLTYQELFANAASCPAVGTPGTIMGYPACVYGFFMFVLLTIVSGVGLWRGREPIGRLTTAAR